MNLTQFLEQREESLYFEVMEDFLLCAEMAVKYEVRDKEKYYAELKEHFKKLQSFNLQTSKMLIEKVIEMIREEHKTCTYGDPCCGCNNLSSSLSKELEALSKKEI